MTQIKFMCTLPFQTTTTNNSNKREVEKKVPPINQSLYHKHLKNVCLQRQEWEVELAVGDINKNFTPSWLELALSCIEFCSVLRFWNQWERVLVRTKQSIPMCTYSVVNGRKQWDRFFSSHQYGISLILESQHYFLSLHLLCAFFCCSLFLFCCKIEFKRKYLIQIQVVVYRFLFSFHHCIMPILLEYTTTTTTTNTVFIFLFCFHKFIFHSFFSIAACIVCLTHAFMENNCRDTSTYTYIYMNSNAEFFLTRTQKNNAFRMDTAKNKKPCKVQNSFDNLMRWYTFEMKYGRLFLTPKKCNSSSNKKNWMKNMK